MTDAIIVAGVVFPRFELLDLCGPYELFGMLGPRVRIVTVAEQRGVVASDQGPKLVAEAAMDDVARTDVLVVPGGFGTRREVTSLPFLRSLTALASRARIVTSVCTGASLLAKAGLLDGRRATSNKQLFDWVASQGPGVRWVRQARWVEDGSYFTSSGVTAGMDMTLAVIARLFGPEEAERAALLAEYTWHRDPDLDPFAAPHAAPTNPPRDGTRE